MSASFIIYYYFSHISFEFVSLCFWCDFCIRSPIWFVGRGPCKTNGRAEMAKQHSLQPVRNLFRLKPSNVSRFTIAIKYKKWMNFMLSEWHIGHTRACRIPSLIYDTNYNSSLVFIVISLCHVEYFPLHSILVIHLFTDTPSNRIHHNIHIIHSTLGFWHLCWNEWSCANGKRQNNWNSKRVSLYGRLAFACNNLMFAKNK